MIFDDETHDIYGLIVSAPDSPVPSSSYINQTEDGPPSDESERLYGKGLFESLEKSQNRNFPILSNFMD